jgi:hypothetical protein
MTPAFSGSDLFTFDLQHMRQLARQYQHSYKAAQPFPHVVIDNFLPAEVAQKLLAHFPAVDSPAFVNRSAKNQPGKFGTVKGENIARTAPYIQHVLAMMNSYVMIQFLMELSGIPKLLPDPHYSGGGLHQIVGGGSLDVHADFNFEPQIELYRRINLLLYLNQDWQESYGGQLELWDKGMTGCVHRIAPVFNRCVIFNTSRYSYHGHPQPLNLPQGMTRKSVALYYYTKQPFPGEEEPHLTLWQDRPNGQH